MFLRHICFWLLLLILYVPLPVQCCRVCIRWPRSTAKLERETQSRTPLKRATRATPASAASRSTICCWAQSSTARQVRRKRMVRYRTFGKEGHTWLFMRVLDEELCIYFTRNLIYRGEKNKKLTHLYNFWSGWLRGGTWFNLIGLDLVFGLGLVLFV